MIALAIKSFICKTCFLSAIKCISITLVIITLFFSSHFYCLSRLLDGFTLKCLIKQNKIMLNVSVNWIFQSLETETKSSKFFSLVGDTANITAASNYARPSSFTCRGLLVVIGTPYRSLLIEGWIYHLAQGVLSDCLQALFCFAWTNHCYQI